MCPVCAVAVGMGLGLSRWLKIDDAISGLWIGGLIISLSFVLAKQTKRLLLVLVLFFSTVIPLKYLGILIDRLVFGIVAGMIIFCLSLLFHLRLKHYFPFQKVVIPVLFLLISSLVLYELFKSFRVY